MLADEPARVDLIQTTIAFDDSRMVEFLQVVKRDARTSDIAFLCAGVLPSVLSDDRPRGHCQAPPTAGQSTLRAAVMECLAQRRQ